VALQSKSVQTVRMSLSFIVGIKTFTHKIDVASQHNTEQVISFPEVGASQVVVSALSSSSLPTITHISFSNAIAVHPVEIRSCESSVSSGSSGCMKLYDGLATSWHPQGSTPWVKFSFGSFTEDNKPSPQRINRMWMKHNWSDRKAQQQRQLLQQRQDGSISPRPDEWIETTQTSELKLTLEYDSRKTETVFVDFDSTEESHEGFAGKAVTVDLKGAETSTVKLTISPSNTVLLSEVMFWYTKESTPAEIRQQGAASTELAGWEAHFMKEADLAQVGYFNKIADAVREAAEWLAMKLCLAGLTVAQGFLKLVKAAIDGIASVLIKLLEAAIKALGPHFFKINDLMIGGSFDGLKGGKTTLEFNIDMWLANVRIGPWGFKTVFTFANIIKKLFGKAKDGLSKVFRL